MTSYVYVPLAASLILALLGRPLARGGRPASMTKLLVVVGVVVALGSAVSAALLAGTLLGQIPRLAAEGHWSAQVFARRDPVSRVVAGAACLALVAALVAAGHFALARQRQFQRARRLSRALPVVGDLAVMRDERPIAHALPGGVVAVSDGMLRRLTGPERRVLLAHERAHLAHHHHTWRLLADACARVDPLLYPLAQAVHGLTERWADEVAATEVGDRQVVASALERALTATRTWRASAVHLAFDRWTVGDRIAALTQAPPRHSWWRIAGLTAVLLAVPVAVAVACNSFDLLYAAAHRAGR